MDARDSEDLADYAQRLYAKKKAQELLLAGRIVDLRSLEVTHKYSYTC